MKQNQYLLIARVISRETDKLVGYDIKNYKGELIKLPLNRVIEFLNNGNREIVNAVLLKNGRLKSKRGVTPTRYTAKTDKKVRLYHGSKFIVNKPEFGKGEDKHDYGRGFYTTGIKRLANEWAVLDGSDGYCNEYELDLNGLRVLDFDNQSVLTWIAELLKHRSGVDKKNKRLIDLQRKFIEKYGISTDGYDIIKGYRADDSYFAIAKYFIKGELSIDLLEECLRLGGLGTQICIKSEKAFKNLKFKGHTVCKCRDYYDDAIRKDTKARDDFQKLLYSDKNNLSNSIYKLDLDK